MMSCKEGRKQVSFSDALEADGFSVLRFDFSFCGESEGEFGEITFTQEVDDLRSAVSWVQEQGGGPLGLVGSSMGGAVAILYASQDPSVKALVTMAAVARPGALADRMDLLKRKMEQWKEEGHIFGAEGDVEESFFEDARLQDVLGAARDLSAPLLVLHGEADEVVPAEEAKALYSNAGGAKDLRILPATDHRFVKDDDLKEALRLTRAWFQRYLRADED